MTLKRPPLGAALYIPAVHPDLDKILAGKKLRHVKDIIICTEDAVAEHELAAALENLQQALSDCHTIPARRCFLRPRNPEICAKIMDFPAAKTHFSGVVLPKFTLNLFEKWSDLLSDYIDDKKHFWIMPTLETSEVFDRQDMKMLAQTLAQSPFGQHILTFRIGGNDLLALLKMRRPRGTTLYETALGKVIADLVTIFIPRGLPLSAPVFEYLDDPVTLSREIVADLNHGLVGKTAVHPDQVARIESHYAVQTCDLQAAQAIVAPNAKGVFRLNGAMCEPATHRPWAEKIISSAQVFGTKGDDLEIELD